MLKLWGSPGGQNDSAGQVRVPSRAQRVPDANDACAVVAPFHGAGWPDTRTATGPNRPRKFSEAPPVRRAWDASAHVSVAAKRVRVKGQYRQFFVVPVRAPPREDRLVLRSGVEAPLY